jgi:putative OPT family oligopeptide transporter
MAEHKPFIPASAKLRELTPGPLILGTLLGVVFGASSLYLVLKVGLTVSASIPVAVISITFYRLLAKLGFRGSTILEDNVVQTAGSAGESIAFGVGVTMPAIMILGFDLEIGRVMLVAVLGGLLGILMMIPLRRALIVENHDTLKYPEGTACAEVLKAGASKESLEASGRGDAGATQQLSARAIFVGFLLGLAYKTAMVAFKAWKDVPERVFSKPLPSASLSAEISPELLGVGYIIGPRVASVMCAGGVLAYLVLIPMIKMFGSTAGVIPPGDDPISGMGPDEIRGAYVLYIGAGAVAAGGLVSLAQALPTIGKSLRAAFGDVFKKRSAGEQAATPRTERDLSPKVVLIGSLALVAVISLAAPLHMNALGAVLIVLLGFLFVTVSSRLTGELGSSSNPISGMTVATLLLTCLVFLLVGWTGPHYYVTALSVGAIVCIAASNGGTTSQDLKTGWLLGATPRSQQIAILVGALASAIALGPILLRLNDAATVWVPETQMIDGVEQHAFHAGLATDPKALGGERETLHGPQAKLDGASYLVWQKTDDALGPPGKYLVNDDGTAKYLVDPGINGTHSIRPDGTEHGTKVVKFAAPKATLMSYIIKGILNRQLPWGLVLLGVMIAVVLEMSGIPSLAFAVGLYLPLSSSTPILAGGIARWLVDRYTKQKNAGRNLTEEELTAEGDKSPGVLLASGYIAGGAIAGIVIAFMAGAMEKTTAAVETWSKAHNPFFEGAWADALSMLPFLLVTVLLVLVGREVLLSGKSR